MADGFARWSESGPAMMKPDQHSGLAASKILIISLESAGEPLGMWTAHHTFERLEWEYEKNPFGNFQGLRWGGDDAAPSGTGWHSVRSSRRVAAGEALVRN